jgi:hypothetical protein
MRANDWQYDHESGAGIQIRGFLAMPTPCLEHGALNERESLSRTLAFRARRYYKRAVPPASVAMTVGYDASHPEPDAIQAWLRSWLLHKADFCVVCLTGPSTGCGCVRALAEEFGIPLVVFVPATGYASPLACGERSITFRSRRELGERFELWLAENRSAIAKADARRCFPLPDSEPERLRQCEAWRGMSEVDRQIAANAMSLNRGAVRDLLCDPVDFAWAPLPVRMAMQRTLGSDGLPTVKLEQGVIEAFRSAVEEYRWTPRDAARTLCAGMEYEENRAEVERMALVDGAFARQNRLTRRVAWRRLHGRVCAARVRS